MIILVKRSGALWNITFLLCKKLNENIITFSENKEIIQFNTIIHFVYMK